MREVVLKYSFTIEDLDMELRDLNIFLTGQELTEVWERYFEYLEEQIDDGDITDVEDLKNLVSEAFYNCKEGLRKDGKIPINADI